MTALIDHLADTLTVARQRYLTPGAVLGSAMATPPLCRSTRPAQRPSPESTPTLSFSSVPRGRTPAPPAAPPAVADRQHHPRQQGHHQPLQPPTTIRPDPVAHHHDRARPTIGGHDSRHHNVPTALWGRTGLSGSNLQTTPRYCSAKSPPQPSSSPGRNATTGGHPRQLHARRRLSAAAPRPSCRTWPNRARAHDLSCSHSSSATASSAYGSPIDYQRRRRLSATATLIDPASWDRISAPGRHQHRRATENCVGTTVDLETITGGALGTPRATCDPSNLRSSIATTASPIAMTPLVAELLDAHARHLLDAVAATTSRPPGLRLPSGRHHRTAGRDPAASTQSTSEHCYAKDWPQAIRPTPRRQPRPRATSHTTTPAPSQAAIDRRQPARRKPVPRTAHPATTSGARCRPTTHPAVHPTEAHVSEHALRSALQRDASRSHHRPASR